MVRTTNHLFKSVYTSGVSMAFENLDASYSFPGWTTNFYCRNLCSHFFYETKKKREIGFFCRDYRFNSVRILPLLH